MSDGINKKHIDTMEPDTYMSLSQQYIKKRNKRGGVYGAV